MICHKKNWAKIEQTSDRIRSHTTQTDTDHEILDTSVATALDPLSFFLNCLKLNQEVS